MICGSRKTPILVQRKSLKLPAPGSSRLRTSSSDQGLSVLDPAQGSHATSLSLGQKLLPMKK
jgi:hypothetical protein